jgi:nicotinamide mononucleotide transporter
MLRYPTVRKLVLSNHLDLLGVLIILIVCYVKDFQGTIYQNGGIEFGIPFRELPNYIQQGAFPLGIVSILSSTFSLLGTRLVGKQNNWGNFIGIIASFTAGSIDYLFGNHSAIITYPLTFFITTFAFKKWQDGVKIKKRDTFYYIIVVVGILIAFALVYLGAYLFGGRTDHAFLIIIALTFGLSLGGNFANAYKYEETWLSWIIYNIVQLTKGIMQLNFANVAKYSFYLINAVVTLFDWKFNGDRSKTAS